jgi:putative tryptophan/tyrosine transport system substrate-binding protein
MKNKYSVISIVVIISLCLAGIIGKKVNKKSSGVCKIAILQTASHPALDAARDGFIATLKADWADAVECTIYNAQGSIVNAHVIAERLHADDSVDAIYAIATPALQAIASVEKTKPIFIAAVTNPYELGVVTETTNIYGTTDMVDISGTINAMNCLRPSIKTVALLYNPSELNSVTQVNLLAQELIKNSIATIRVGVTTEMEIPHAIATVVSKVDALLTPTDNLIACAMPLVSHIARVAKKPLIACHNQAVEQGALMARGVDYYKSGQETGEIALAVLRDGKNPCNIPIIPSSSDTIVINKDVVDELAITMTDTSDTIMYVTSQK